MFSKILKWIKGVWSAMFGQSDIKKALNVDVAISPEMAGALSLWAAMYSNKSPWLDDDIKSLNLAAGIASEIARMTTIEMQVQVSGGSRAAFLQKQLAPVLEKLREKVEVGIAKGGLVMKPYVEGKRIAVDFVQADHFYPVAFDGNGNISGAIFTDQKTIGDFIYTRLEIHEMGPAGCRVRNYAFRSTDRETLGGMCALSEVREWAELEPNSIIEGVDRPLFAYFKNPAANKVDPKSPLGASGYAAATDLIKQADVMWSDFLWEFESGRRALYVDELAFDRDAVTGEPVLPYKRLIRTLKLGGSEEDFYEEWSPNFREENILNGLDAILKKIEFECGLAYGTLSDPAIEAKTATEVKTSKQRTYATVTDTQKALRKALEVLIWAMDVWITLDVELARQAGKGSYQTAFDFDDSVVVDSELQFAQDMQAVNAGLMPKWEFRVRNYGETEEIAKKKIAEAQGEMQKEASFFEDEGR